MIYQHGLWPDLPAKRGRYEAFLDRLVCGGKDCPVPGGLALSQWVQHAYETCVSLDKEICVMAGKKVVSTKTVPNVAWVNYKLTDSDVSQFQAWDAPSDDVHAVLVELITEGYRLTFSFDHVNKALQCSVVCNAEGNANFGKGFSTYSKDYYKLISLVVFKHAVLFERVWPEPAINPSGRDFN